MDSREMVASLCVNLPEDILKKKWAGDMNAAMQAIDERLTQDLPRMLRARLAVEKERLRRLPLQYPWNHAEAFEKLRELVPDVTMEEFERCEAQGLVDFIYLNGERRYFIRFHKALCRLPYFLKKADELRPESPYLDPLIAQVKRQGRLKKRITIEASIAAARNAFVPGEYRAWLPFALEEAQQSHVKVEETNATLLADGSAPARTAFRQWQAESVEDRFRIRYSYDSEIIYADPRNASAPASPLYPSARPLSAEDLAEDGTFIRFTPLLRSLAEEISAGAVTQVEKAWRCYEYVTTKVKYAYVRQYFQIDDIGEYCALNGKGDCGLQAILFINLCRILGVPARWQSGLSISEDGAGSHDWAQFYLDGWGWLFADPSFGGSAWRSGATERWQYYFGNLDPMRMAANRSFMPELTPAMAALRVDPYDSQTGELERVGAGMPFVGRELDEEADVVQVEG